MRILRHVAGWIAGLLVLIWRLTCRYRVLNDPRPALRAANTPYIYAILHAHQIAALFVCDDRIAAMVSRSADGDLLVPTLRLRRVVPVRGSTRKAGQDKGGRKALQNLAAMLEQRVAALLAVDGPRGPRNHVHRGVADLALQTGATVLPTIILPSRRWFLSRTWDRMQLPQPFSTVRLIFTDPVVPREGENPEQLRERIKCALDNLEAFHDPQEAACSVDAHPHARIESSV